MRKLIVSMNCTLDGYLSGPQCEMDWHFKHWTSDMSDALCEQLSRADTVLMGRTTYEVFSRFSNPRLQLEVTGYDNFPFFDMLNRYEKIVFSKTLREVHWQHTTVCSSAVKSKILQLKKRSGWNIILYGSATLLYSLQQLNVIDEYHLYIHPIVLGNGKPLFKNEGGKHEFVTKTIDRFSSGVIMMQLQKPSI